MQEKDRAGAALENAVPANATEVWVYIPIALQAQA